MGITAINDEWPMIVKLVVFLRPVGVFLGYILAYSGLKYMASHSAVALGVEKKTPSAARAGNFVLGGEVKKPGEAEYIWVAGNGLLKVAIQAAKVPPLKRK